MTSHSGVQGLIRNHKSLPVSKRQAQRLVQVAAFSLEGVQMYWGRNPAALSRLAARVAELEAWKWMTLRSPLPTKKAPCMSSEISRFPYRRFFFYPTQIGSGRLVLGQIIRYPL